MCIFIMVAAPAMAEDNQAAPAPSPPPQKSPAASRKAAVSIPPKQREMMKIGLMAIGAYAGGLLAGGCLLVIAAQRRQAAAGFAALLASVALGAWLGTWATMIPAAALFFYLRIKLPPPGPCGPVRPWVALVCTLLVLVVFAVLQGGATTIAIAPIAIDSGGRIKQRILTGLMTDGTVARAIIGSAWIGILLLVIVCGRNWPERLGLRSCRLRPALLWSLLAFIAMLGIGSLFGGAADAKSMKSLDLMGKMSGSPLVFVLAIGVAAPIFEELLLRGYAFGAWIEKIGFVGTFFATSVIFSLAHLQYGWAGLAAVFLLGLVMCFLRWKTQSIYPSIAVHALNNLTHCIIVFLWPG